MTIWAFTSTLKSSIRPCAVYPVAAKAKAADAGMDLSTILICVLTCRKRPGQSQPRTPPTPVKQTATATSDDNNMLSFDMGDLSLDLDSSAQLDQLDGLPEAIPWKPNCPWQLSSWPLATKTVPVRWQKRCWSRPLVRSK